MYNAIIAPNQLQELLSTNKDLLLFDCHHDLKDPEAGRKKWQRERIAEADFLHLDKDLSGPIIPGQTGRHPLPTKEKFLSVVTSKGFVPGSNQQIVLYDSKFGGIAARAWWMFKWISHENVAVLDGGYPAWEAYLDRQRVSAIEEFEVLSTRRTSQALRSVSADEHDEQRASTSIATPSGSTSGRAGLKTKKEIQIEVYSRLEVDDIRQDKNYTLIDSRTSERYRGEHEPIDPVAGHIEGAINLPWPENLDENGRFKSIAELKSRFAPLKEQAAQNIFYCGSGVTACHNILAYYHTFGEMPGLYAGSWSEWITL